MAHFGSGPHAIKVAGYRNTLQEFFLYIVTWSLVDIFSESQSADYRSMCLFYNCHSDCESSSLQSQYIQMSRIFFSQFID